MVAVAEQKTAPLPFRKKRVTWFCIRSQAKHERVVAAHLRTMEGVQVFLPQIRFQRSTRRGTAWVTEALFPGYLFARFDLQASLRRVQTARGARDVVHFGGQWPEIPAPVIEELRQLFGEGDLHTISPALDARCGD
jgi:transcriptional antiterminator RfaH